LDQPLCGTRWATRVCALPKDQKTVQCGTGSVVGVAQACGEAPIPECRLSAERPASCETSPLSSPANRLPRRRTSTPAFRCRRNKDWRSSTRAAARRMTCGLRSPDHRSQLGPTRLPDLRPIHHPREPRDQKPPHAQKSLGVVQSALNWALLGSQRFSKA